MTLHHVIAPPSPLQAMLKVERPTVQQNLNFITTNIALEGEGEAQSFFHMGSLIIFVRDCGSTKVIFKLNCFEEMATMLNRHYCHSNGNNILNYFKIS